MINAIRSEWIKQSTVTVTLVLVIIAAVFPVVVSALTAAGADGVFDGDDLASVIAGTSVVSTMLLGVLGSLAITSEFSHNTIRPTFAALPDRLRPLLAKPIQMNFDPAGRLWVASSEVYPQIVPGQAANDKVLVLESGRFAIGWGEMAAMLGCDIEVLPGSMRRAVDPATAVNFRRPTPHVSGVTVSPLARWRYPHRGRTGPLRTVPRI